MQGFLINLPNFSIENGRKWLRSNVQVLEQNRSMDTEKKYDVFNVEI